MGRIGLVIAAAGLLGACAAQPSARDQRAPGEIAPSARPHIPTQADPLDPVTGMTDRDMKAR